MPELPEVETVRQRLEQVLIGKIISQIQVLRNKSFQGQTQKVVGASIEAVSRKAKLLRLQLDNGLNLLIHLKMTGQLIFVNDDVKTGGGHPTADWVKNLPSKHTRVIIEFSDDSKLYFNDMRVFGWMRVLDDKQVLAEFNKYGPDVVDENFTAEYLQKKLANRTIAIKEAIMINQIVGGIGNIYANEALFEAGIDPRRSAKSLSLDELRRLVTASKRVIRAGLKAGGTTFDGRYVDVDGLAGSYQNQLKVYGKEGEPCPNCQGKVKKIKIGQRGTYFCPQCQN